MGDGRFVAVVGAGAWGRNHVRNFNTLGVLRTVCDADPRVREKLAADFPGTNAVATLAEALADPAVRGVVVATPAESHFAQAREALLAGRDVLVEKPLCLAEEDGAELISLAETRGAILMVGHLLWYHPAVLRLKELIAAGELGRIRYIYSNRLNLGKIRREENALWSFAPHDISVILGLLGESPDEVQAQGGNYLHERIADVTTSLLSFPSGVKAHIFVSWLHPFKEQKLVVVGDRKMAVFDDLLPWPEKLLLYPHHIEWHGNVPVASRETAEPVAVAEAEPLRDECAHFLDCIERRERPRTDGREGLDVLRVLRCCQQAMETRRSVRVQGCGEAPKPWFAHPTAVVDDGAEVGAGTKIWHFSHILPGSRIGEGCTIGQNVVVGPRATVGRGCKIQNNVSVYEGVTLEDDVFCGPSMVFTNVNNPRAAIVRRHEFKPTLVRQGATIGANATIVCGHVIGRYAFVGAGAVVTRDLPDFALAVGNPAGPIGWMCRCGVRLPLPVGAVGEAVCAACGAGYRDDGAGLREVPPGDTLQR
jgi:UDP-2-acetamido-3-amino-2,3-dideoxy-glucuronate N-acetyltransferase